MRAIIVAVVVLLLAVPVTVYVAKMKRPHTAIRIMLTETAKGKEASPARFFQALHHFVNEKEALLADEGRAVEVGNHVVVILRTGPGEQGRKLPGTDSHMLLLLDRSGHLLDEMKCALLCGRAIDELIPTFSYTYLTDKNGTELAIRAVPDSLRPLPKGCFRETVHHDKTQTVYWESANGVLIRVRVRDGTFEFEANY